MSDKTEIYQQLDKILEYSFNNTENIAHKRDTESPEKENSTSNSITVSTDSSPISKTDTESTFESEKEKIDVNLNSSQNIIYQEDQDLFLKRIRKIIDQEIENIITKIYEFHIYKQTTSNERELKVFEKNINFYITNAGVEFNVTILKIITEKIPKILKLIIDQIFDSPEIQKLKETFESVFYEKKRTIPVHTHHHKYYCCKCHHRLMNISKQEDETKLSIMLSFGKAFQNLQKIYHGIVKSSSDMEIIFSTPMNYLFLKKEKIKFEKIHSGEFSKILHTDCCIKNIVSQLIKFVKSKEDNKNELISTMNEFFNEMESIEESQMEELKRLVNEAISKTQNDSEESFQNIDDLLNYINEKDIKNKSKSKKNKIKPKKIIMNDTNKFEKLEKDFVVEDFKYLLKMESVNANNIIKIKPSISRKFLSKLIS